MQRASPRQSAVVMVPEAITSPGSSCGPWCLHLVVNSFLTFGDFRMSSKLAIVTATLLASAVFVTSASAATLWVVNNDKVHHDLRLLAAGAKKGVKPTAVKIDAGKTVDSMFDCSKGCAAHLGKKDKGAKDLILKGTETTITIAADGVLSVK
jgi:hypothetical protein